MTPAPGYRTERTSSRLRAMLLAATLAGLSGAWLTARKTEPTALGEAIRAGTLVAQLNDVPSHDGRYRGTLIPQLDRAGQLADWRIRVATPAGKALTGPTLVMRSWMPEDSGAVGDRPTLTDLGGGTFRVDGLRFGRPGWWNVSLAISDAGVTDSLAFNLVIP